mgnify:CR=1 FL=1
MNERALFPQRLTDARGFDIAQAMREAGYDWVFVDLEHGTMSLDTAMQISVAALGAGITSLVRVPRGQYDMATRVLDGGAWGIVMPHVDSAAEAREVVDRLKYPPAGHRSVVGALPQIGFGAMAMAESTAAINTGMLVVVMIETPLAVENAERIAAVAGIDVLLMGSNDLCMEMGIPGKLDDPKLVAAFDTVLAACKKHKKWPGLGGVYAKPLLGTYMAKGFKFILSGNDLGLLMAAASDQATFVKSHKPENR